jgi:RNA polymerase sigma-B factor
MGAQAQDSRADTIEAHLPLVRSIARRYARRGESYEDLVQAGTIGLIKAVDRFDPARHRDLVSLARPSIEGEIRHSLRDDGRGAHVPRTDRELALRLEAATTELTARHGRPPSVAELARAAGVDEQRAGWALQARDAARPVPLAEAQADRGVAGRTDETEAAEARVLLHAGWSLLDDRERRMLELRYHEERSQSEIARELGLSQAHVSRLLRAALERLRAAVDPAAATEPDEATGEPDAEPAAPAAGGRSGRLLLRLPRTLHTELADAAEREGVPLNTYISGTLAAAVGHPAEEAAAPALEPGPAQPPRRLLLINAVVIALAALAGIALLLTAWLG